MSKLINRSSNQSPFYSPHNIQCIAKGEVKLVFHNEGATDYLKKPSNVRFESGSHDNDTMFRLAVYKHRRMPGAELLLKKEVMLDRASVRGIINGIEYNVTKEGTPKDIFPTITVIMSRLSIELIFIDSKSDEQLKRHHEWFSKLKSHLQFEGSWKLLQIRGTADINSVDQRSNNYVILCITRSYLSILCTFGGSKYRILNEYPIEEMICCTKELHRNVYGGNDALICVTFVNTHRNVPKSHEFKIEHDVNISEEIINVLMMLRPQNHYHDIEASINGSIYDLNRLSLHEPVRGVVHTPSPVWNQHCFGRRVPDLPTAQRTVTYWSIIGTLVESLRMHAPQPDTLGLSPELRFRICFELLDNLKPTWRKLADEIGMTQAAVRVIETVFESPICTAQIITPTECVLRHWQYMHNLQQTPIIDRDEQKTGMYSDTWQCSREGLIGVLGRIERYDLVERLQREA